MQDKYIVLFIIETENILKQTAPKSTTLYKNRELSKTFTADGEQQRPPLNLCSFLVILN